MSGISGIRTWAEPEQEFEKWSVYLSLYAPSQGWSSPVVVATGLARGVQAGVGWQGSNVLVAYERRKQLEVALTDGRSVLATVVLPNTLGEGATAPLVFRTRKTTWIYWTTWLAAPRYNTIHYTVLEVDGTWRAPHQVVTDMGAYHPSPLELHDGRIFLTFTRPDGGNGRSVWVSEYQEGWSAPVRVLGAGNVDCAWSALFQEDQQLHCVASCRDKQGEGGYALTLAHTTTTRWSSPSPLREGTLSSHMRQFFVNASLAPSVLFFGEGYGTLKLKLARNLTASRVFQPNVRIRMVDGTSVCEVQTRGQRGLILRILGRQSPSDPWRMLSTHHVPVDRVQHDTVLPRGFLELQAQLYGLSEGRVLAKARTGESTSRRAHPKEE